MWIYFKIQVTKNIHTQTKPFSFNTTNQEILQMAEVSQ